MGLRRAGWSWSSWKKIHSPRRVGARHDNGGGIGALRISQCGPQAERWRWREVSCSSGPSGSSPHICKYWCRPLGCLFAHKAPQSPRTPDPEGLPRTPGGPQSRPGMQKEKKHPMNKGEILCPLSFPRPHTRSKAG